MFLRSEKTEERVVIWGYDEPEEPAYVLRVELLLKDKVARAEGLIARRLLKRREIAELLGYLEGLASHMGAQELEVFVDPHYQQLYERGGFKVSGETDVAGHRLTIMCKEL